MIQSVNRLRNIHNRMYSKVQSRELYNIVDNVCVHSEVYSVEGHIHIRNDKSYGILSDCLQKKGSNFGRVN